MLFKHFFVIVTLFAITVPCLSQSSQDYGKYANNFKFHQGYVVTRSGDKIQGLLKHFNDLRVYAKVVFVSQIGFKKTFAQFFQDCPELQKKIEQKKFKYKNLAQMFGFYRNVYSKENNTESTF